MLFNFYQLSFQAGWLYKRIYLLKASMAVSKPPRTTEVLLSRKRSVAMFGLAMVDLLDNGLLKGWKRSFSLVPIKPRHRFAAPVGIKVVYFKPPIFCDCSLINHFRV